jgi:hypothetical protein
VPADIDDRRKSGQFGSQDYPTGLPKTAETDDEERERLLIAKGKESCCRKFYSNSEMLVKYVVSDLTRKKSSFSIGVFTVFLVVSVITMLKGVIDAMPVLFLQISESSVGAIDYKLATRSPGIAELHNGNVNYYGIDPWDNKHFLHSSRKSQVNSGDKQKSNSLKSQRGYK